MALQELAFESLSMALESTRGTAVTPPTRRLNMGGTITPMQELYRPPDQLGTLEEYYRSVVVRQWAEWEGSGGVDVTAMPFILNMAVKGVTTPTTPTNGVLTRLWTFVPTLTADDLKTATLYWGDNVNALLWQGKYGTLDTMEITADASGTDGVTIDLAGHTQFPTHLGANPTLPAITVGPALIPAAMQLWIDTSSAIGTTAITGRLVSVSVSVPTQFTYKYVATGPGGSVTYDHVGRARRHIEAKLRFELADAVQYDLFAAHTTCKTRIRFNGDLIESVTPDYYNYLQFDIYGPMSEPSWGDLEGTNRTVEFTVMSEYNSTLGASWAAYVQNTLTALP
jgi:hypothetical protein